MRTLLGVVATAATLFVGGSQAIHATGGRRAEDTVMFPDVHGKMVRISIAHSYAECRKNGHHLGYPDADSHTWCTEHCKGNICQ
jgi:hypothetical protein